MATKMLKMRHAGVEIPRRLLSDRAAIAWEGGLAVRDTTDHGVHRMVALARFTRVVGIIKYECVLRSVSVDARLKYKIRDLPPP